MYTKNSSKIMEARFFQNQYERRVHEDHTITCHDIDECSRGDHGCHADATCINTEGKGI